MDCYYSIGTMIEVVEVHKVSKRWIFYHISFAFELNQNVTHDFQLQVVVCGPRVAVDPHEDGVEARRDEPERQNVATRVRSFVRRILERYCAALDTPLVRYRF